MSRKPFFRNILFLVLCLFGGFDSPAQTLRSNLFGISPLKFGDLTNGKPKACCGQSDNSIETFTLIGSYYSLKNGQETVLMFNNKGPEPLVVAPVFFTLSGDRLDLSVLTIPAKSYQEYDVRELLAGNLPEFKEGSLQVSHQGGRLQLGAQFKILKGGMIFDEQFIQPATRYPSNRLESVWWLPSTDAQTKFILSNTTGATVTATLTVDGTIPHQQQPATIQLNAHETRVLDILEDLVGANGELKKDGGISITHNGSAGAVMARIFVSKASEGYSSVFNFTDPTTPLSSKLNGGGLRIGAIGTDDLKPIVVARNIGTEITTVSGQIPYTDAYGEVAFITIPSIEINPGKTKHINLRQEILAANLPATITFGGIELEYSTAPGSVVMNALSVSQSGEQVFQVPLLDPQRLPSSAGGFPWKVDGDYTTVIFIKNESDVPKKYIANLTYEGGGYSTGVREVKPGQTIMVDFKQLRDNQAADGSGNLIPLAMNKGQASWTMMGAGNKQMTGRSEQVNLVTGVSSTYACYNCCPDNVYSTGTTFPVFVAAEVNDSNFIYVGAQSVNCYGQTSGTFPMLGDGWLSSYPSVATITDEGDSLAIAPGGTYFNGGFNSERWDFDGRDCYGSNTRENGEGEMQVQPTVTNVTAVEATKITQVTGNQNIVHIVTPKITGNILQAILTATINPDTKEIRNQITWEGASQAPDNPLEARISRNTPGKYIVKIKYGNTTLKEIRFWVVWSTTTSPSGFPIESSSNGTFGIPPGTGLATRGGYTFNHTIQPSSIITDADRPNFSGSNITPAPGGTHPFTGASLSGGANRKWDVSRQMRAHILNPANISGNDFLQPPFTDINNYPVSIVIGNDDANVLNENNDPYSNNGILTDSDRPIYGIVDRAAANGDTYDARLHFIQFTRLEIEGTWTRISDDFLWRIHFRFLKVNGLWTDNGTSKALDNSGF